MKWVEALRGEIVGLDTAPLIYFTEDHPEYQKVVDPFFEELGRNGFTVVTSILTLAETLIVPLKKGDILRTQKYREFLLKTVNVTTVDVTREIAEKAAQLRAAYTKLETPDAIHIATALEGKATYFLTNDKVLRCVTELNVLVLDELKAAS